VRRFDSWHSVYGEIFEVCRDSETSQVGLDAILAKLARKERNGDISPCFASLLRECVAELKLNPKLILSDKEFQEDYGPLDASDGLDLPKAPRGNVAPAPKQRRRNVEYDDVGPSQKDRKNEVVRKSPEWKEIYDYCLKLCRENGSDFSWGNLAKNVGENQYSSEDFKALAGFMFRKLREDPKYFETPEFVKLFAPIS